MKLRVICVLLVALSAFGASAGTQFPFDRELVLQAKPIRPAKRVPMLTVEPNGDAVIDLWCKSVTGRIELSAEAIHITPAPLPEALPEMMAQGQCTPERVAADERRSPR
jgi:hypothetical protein